MREDYFLKIGGVEVLDQATLDRLSDADDDVVAKARSILAEQLKQTRVRVGTLLKTDNTSFLLGAGASMKAGGVGLASLPMEIEAALHRGTQDKTTDSLPGLLELFYRTVSAITGVSIDPVERAALLVAESIEAEPIPVNLEDYFSQLFTWRASVMKGATGITLELPHGEQVTLCGDDIDELIARLKAGLAAVVRLPVVGKEESLRDHRRLIGKVLTRPLNLRRVNLFTLNYDTLIEQAADAEGAVLVDGFVGSLRRVFRPESYDLDFYFPAQTTEGRVHRFDRALHLYKLHGSISWHGCDADWNNPFGLYASVDKDDRSAGDFLVYPSPMKYGQALGLPYSELFRRFGSTVAQPQSVLFVIGYGFGDEHVNAIIRQALAIPSFTLVIVDPVPTCDFVTRLDEIRDERVWIVGGWSLGTLSCFVEKLLPDLREEEVALKTQATYNALGLTARNYTDGMGSGDDD